MRLPISDRGEGLVLGELTQPAGHRLGPRELAAEEHEQEQIIGVLLAVSTLLAAEPGATASQISAMAT